jgi:hypothetical protein
LKEVILAPTLTVTKLCVKDAFLAYWIWKLVSLRELSAQFRMTRALPPCREAVARTLDGGSGGVVIEATLENPEFPERLNAYTR